MCLHKLITYAFIIHLCHNFGKFISFDFCFRADDLEGHLSCDCHEQMPAMKSRPCVDLQQDDSANSSACVEIQVD